MTPSSAAVPNPSPLQQRLRDEHAWFCAAVYWHPGDYYRDAIVRELRRMKETGFTAVRFHNCKPKWDAEKGEIDFTRTDDWISAAEEAGIDMILHFTPRKPDAAFLQSRGIDAEAFERSHLDGPEHRDALEAWMRPIFHRYLDRDDIVGYELYGEPGAGETGIDSEYDRKRFAQWLEERYESIEALDRAWNLYPEAGKLIAPSFDEAWRVLEGFNAAEQVSGAHRAKMNYGAGRDALRYLVDKFIARAGAVVKTFHKIDDRHVALVGSHQLFLNPAAMRWDFSAWGKLGDCHFSSLHLPWHFEMVEGEVDRPVIMQAKLTNDYLKDGYTSAFETIGGPVQYSGGYGTAMTEGLIRRHCAAYLGAGNQSMAFWTWNHRPGGWEVGEYGLTSLTGKVTPWAHEIGKFARGMERYIGELWEADPQTRVALFESWDTDAILNFEPLRHDLRDLPGRFSQGTSTQASRARIGAARAMLNHHVAYEYLTNDELFEGIASRYPVIYAPHLRALSIETIDALRAYVEAGGHLIADVQFAFLDPWGKMHQPGDGGPVETIFGAYIDGIHDTRTAERSVNGVAIEGFFGELVPTRARTIARFDTGAPAITDTTLGQGMATLVAFDAGRMCHRPGRDGIEALLADLVTRGAAPAWRTNAPLAMRRVTDAADHYFLINDGPACTAWINAYDASYTAGLDVLDDRVIDVTGSIAVPLNAESATWVRLEK